ncbi:ferric reductase like transmembrane component-domain-containing protein [Aspergillus pseudoustus]|uniref:ferric-chelate reductase (NADPH) n=1 Tax=Aspergillus pseudoustus TaxID=1810923 RepID=A0ABR4JAY5_9EURO
MVLHGRHGHESDPQELYYQQIDTDLAHYALLALGCFAALLLVWRTAACVSCYLRQVACLTNDRQQYFVPASRWLALARQHFLYAPLFRTRHNREFQLSRAVNMGTLPSRNHACILVAILAMNAAMCTVNVPYKTDSAASVIRNRTGTMATVNLIPLVLMAGRNNPLISLLRVPYDTFNLLHRWLARIVVLEALAHVLAWCIPKAQIGGWDAIQSAFNNSSFIRSGLIAACAFTFLLIHSPSPIRHAFYETFLHLHIAVVAASFVFLWIHLNGRPAQHFLLAAIILWAVERSVRIMTILYRNCSRTPTTATIEALPDDLVKIALHLPRPWTVTPGQHIYLYIPAIALWTSHPFSVCWSDYDEKNPTNTSENDKTITTSSTIHLLLRRRTGFTDTLSRRVRKNMNQQLLSVRAIVEGPYGGTHSLDSYGTVLLFAGGVGITHHLLYLRRLARGMADGTVAARRVTLVWAVRSLEYLAWAEEWIGRILGNGKGKEQEEEKGEEKGEVQEEEVHDASRTATALRILVYVTGSYDADDAIRISSRLTADDGRIQVFGGRPSFDTLLGLEIGNQIGAMGVLCCGNGCFSDDVRKVCRDAQSKSHIDFFEESFTW